MITFEGHVYLDHHYPPITWNIVRGGFDSVDLLPEGERDFAISISLASMIQNSSARRLEAELSLELVRMAVAPSSVSRLRGIFVFSDLESVSRIWESNRWGHHFINEYLADVGVYARRSTKVDATWIEDIISKQGELLPGWREAAIKYWSGVAKSAAEPIWETIVEGSLCIWSMHSKESALKEISAIWPDSLGLLKHSINCYGVGSQDGQSFPGLIGSKNGISLNYYLRMVDSLDPQFIERVTKFPIENPKLSAGHPDHERMHLPDLRGYSKVICRKNNDALVNLLALLAAIQKTSARNDVY
ncbi:hypothetical protein [Rubrivivax gelatinosus]|uniref:hypothetical protein n=1 Tax=Rubrivivax gelatinosus TaxID=28068 RepID=UPI0012FE1A1B|nr:hypothetical protein [Rubrivivax gelatinosus]MBG6078987.1 hypothetical protein [Rubrivivax gelatinosus]